MTRAMKYCKNLFQKVNKMAEKRCISASRALFAADNNSGKELEELKKNPYFNKYATKITAFENKAPDEFFTKVLSTNINKKLSRKFRRMDERGYSELGTPKPDITWSATKQKKLESIMKMDLLQDKTPEEIGEIWRDFHKNQERISAVIPGETYTLINQRSKLFPVFLYPVPRDKGFEFVVAQFDNHECHFTTLINYQAYKENAPECLTITHYPDLNTDKGIVLMQGDFDKNVLNAHEAQCLANQLQLYYTSPETDNKYSLLHKFTNHPDSFRHMDLIAELQNTSITTPGS